MEEIDIPRRAEVLGVLHPDEDSHLLRTPHAGEVGRAIDAHQVLVPFDDPSGRTVAVYITDITAEVDDITDFYLLVY